MIYIDKCRTDLGVTVDEWAVDDSDVLVRLVISDSCSDNVSRFSCREVLSHE